LVFLYEVDVKPVVNQLAFLEDFRKELLRIHVTNRLKQLDIGDIGLQNSHTVPYNIGNGRCLRTAPEKEKHLRRRAAGKAGRAAAPSAGLALRPAPFPGLYIGLLFGNVRYAQAL
jgi:hypothetical protein